MSANQLLIVAQRAEVFIGEFKGCMHGGREQDGIVGSDSHLSISDVWSDEHPLGCFEYS